MGLTYTAANAVYSKSVEIIKSMVGQYANLDKATTEFKKVSDLSGESLNTYVKQLGELGKTTGRTASEMIEAATQFRKNSFNDKDSAILAELATRYQNVADTEISAADSASFIISQMKAFHIEASDAAEIIDKVNYTANNFAVGTNDLSSALEVAGAGLSTYNNSYDETIALVTAGSEVMTGRSLQVARGLNTIASRLVNNEKTLNQYGVALKDSNGELRSTFDILSDLSEAWNQMNAETQVSVGNTLAGTNQYKVLAAVMKNFASAQEVVAKMGNSINSSMIENSRYMESYEA